MFLAKQDDKVSWSEQDIQASKIWLQRIGKWTL